MAEAVTLAQMLLAREQRAEKQQQLLARFRRPLICFTMNIPGPVKTDPLIERGFFLGLSRLDAQLLGSGIPVKHREHRCSITGCEGYYAVETSAPLAKALCLEIEQAEPIGRLFDLDVLDETGNKLSRGAQRTCLLCGKPAQICGRSRAHSVEELQAEVTRLLTDALNREDRERIAQLAVKSLLCEVAVAPKPGLVDRDNPGSHRDMDIFTFLGSASVLQPYFARCAQIGQESAALPPREVFARLRYPGKLAEGAMYRETQGVNTHKGAIFSLGLLCAAVGMLPWEERTPEAILDLCAQMTQGLVEAELGRDAQTPGQRLFREYGITGVRGQAQRGFPAVKDTGLPILRQGLAQGLSLNDAAADALLHILTRTEDTNLIARSDLQTQQDIVREVAALLTCDPFPSREQLAALDREFTAKNLSPGGSADLLSLTLFLHFLCEN